MPAETGHHPNTVYREQGTGALHTVGTTTYDGNDTALVAPGANGLSQKGYCHVLYDFAVDGGAISTITPATAVALPAGAVVTDAYANVLTGFTGGGSCAFAVNIEGAGDLRVAAVIATGGFNTTGIKALIPVGTAATFVPTTVARKLTLTPSVAAITAGKAIFWLEYVV